MCPDPANVYFCSPSFKAVVNIPLGKETRSSVLGVWTSLDNFVDETLFLELPFRPGKTISSRFITIATGM